MTLKGDKSKTVPYEITKNGKYTFIVTGTYNEKIITKEIEVLVNKYQAATGLVQYDAGDWTQEEIEELQSSLLYDINVNHKTSKVPKKENENGFDFTFGGFTYKEDTINQSAINSREVITSRNQSVSPESGYGTPNYDGWQILASYEESGKTYVTKVVHSGSPENFVYDYKTTGDAYRAAYILSSGQSQKRYNTYQARNWNLYKDKELDLQGMINNIHTMTLSEAQNAKSNNILNTGASYWLPEIYPYAEDMGTTNSGVHVVRPIGMQLRYIQNYNVSKHYNCCLGVRPVVEFNDEVYIIEGSGTEADPYVLGKE